MSPHCSPFLCNCSLFLDDRGVTTHPVKMTTLLGPTDEFSKKPTLISSSASWLEDSKETAPQSPCHGALSIILENVPSWKTVVLVVVRTGLRGEMAGRAFLFITFQSTCRTRDQHGLFKIPWLGRALWPSLRGDNVPVVQNRERLKKGGHFNFPLKTPSLFGCRIWWMFYFCYQISSNSIIWPSSGRIKLTVQKGKWRIFKTTVFFLASVRK